MPADKLFQAEILEGETHYKGENFRYVIYTNPKSLPKATRQAIVDRFGTRYVNGEACLGITKADAQRNLDNREYTAIAFVENTDGVKKDEGSGALQYYDWCESRNPQLWINDLCRVTELDQGQTKPSVSPIELLLVLFEELAQTKHVAKMHLMVDDDKREVLAPIYERYGYKETHTCRVPEQFVMVKRIRGRTMRRTTRRRRTRNATQN